MHELPSTDKELLGEVLEFVLGIDSIVIDQLDVFDFLHFSFLASRGLSLQGIMTVRDS